MRWSSIVGAAALLLLVVVTVGQTQDACRVDLGRGWSTGVGQGRIVMKNTGAGCGATLAADPDAAILVDDIQLTARPRHGVVTLAPPRFTYTPDAGFAGADNFSLSARGASRDGRR